MTAAYDAFTTPATLDAASAATLTAVALTGIVILIGGLVLNRHVRQAFAATR